MSARPHYLKGENRVVCVRPETWAKLKRLSARYWRRLNNRLLDDAPRRLPTRGWFS